MPNVADVVKIAVAACVLIHAACPPLRTAQAHAPRSQECTVARTTDNLPLSACHMPRHTRAHPSAIARGILQLGAGELRTVIASLNPQPSRAYRKESLL